MNRRDFLGLIVKSATACAYLLNVPAAHARATPPELRSPALAAFMDTLIPADSTPSASQLGLEQKLIGHATTIENYVPLLDLGCEWLDAQARLLRKVGFKQLDQEDRDRIVSMAEASPAGSIPRQFFDRVRADLFDLYYSHPSIWPSLGFPGSPQPAGYLDYVSAPHSPRT